ncbi:hypothetical protein SEPL_084 [Salmonella phage SE_PL]|uniref:hypothetical protein n=1 Tax=Salmonella enterica TaxID=28901 RepID=UPI000FDFAA64|nr:hypothetical protein CPT_Munch_343 [Salmonella phage Munch]EAZ2022637.1 hypothetical protein [Salmonella enterica]ECV9083771.1 hypothetical protein [Salmonella enterica subsp. enterica serovar Infantis]MCP0435638.1 hypothetical protein [Salmonella enterica subsp. enterica serovar Mbandaka]QCW19040.1 hypothetical protein 7t3_0520 [Salmonella phage 7t3]QIG62697.1 hypothetical protein SEPL_084 [Salmonella phage SE_PL]WNV47450.1 hypothetical protein [Klebsiella phage fENko-Kae01]
MEQKAFYNRMYENREAFEKVIYELEQMIDQAPNARTRTQAELAKNQLIQVQMIADAFREYSNKKG